MKAARIVKLNASPRTSNTNTKRYTSFDQGQPLKTTDRGVKYPLTPGHGIAGTVEFKKTG